MPMMYAAGHISFVLTLSLLAVHIPSDLAQAQGSPRFETAECPFEGGTWLEAERIECGYLIVPERRGVEGARTLRMAVAVVRSTSESPRPDPVVFLTGGPGGSTLRAMQARLTSRLWRSLRAERDLVFVDQRGTGYSGPISCPELFEVVNRMFYEGTPEEERREEVRREIRECRERITTSGVDLGAYHSATSARDLAELRVALGYDEWNLYGASYGTRLALVTMRDVPQGLRSVILEAAIPPNAPEQRLTNYDRALGELFAACAADPECAAEYPDLEQRFYTVLEDLEANPLIVPAPRSPSTPSGEITLGSDGAAIAVHQALYRDYTIALVPLLIQVLEARNHNALQALVDIATRDASGLNRGLYLSVECYERAPYLTPEALQADRERAPRLAPHGDLLRTLLHDCDAWHEYRASPAELAAVSSEIPTLILAGTLDPITPPAWGRLAGETLPNSYYMEARPGGHGPPKDACTRGIMLDFLNDPTTSPDMACNEARAPLSFVTDVYINPGVYRVATALRRGPSTVLVIWFGLTILTLVSATVGWPAARLVRRLRKRQATSTGLAVAARWVAWLAALAAMVFLVGLGWTIQRTAREAPLILGFGVPGSAAPLFLVPWFVLVLGVVALALTTSAWHGSGWSSASRVHCAAVGTACLSFVGLLAYMRLF